MAAITERDRFEIAALTSEKIGRRLTPPPSSLLERPSFKDSVADAIEAFQVASDDQRDVYVVLVSNPDYPHSVRESVRKAVEAAEALPGDLARRVLLPICSGELGARSFALYPRFFPFSTDKVIRRFEKSAAMDSVCGWLGAIARATRTPVVGALRAEELFCAPLRRLAAEPMFSDHLRARAAAVLQRFDDAKFAPSTVVQHGDFWMGNILFARPWSVRTLKREFAVIDWGSSRLDGAPYFDLIKYFDSSEKDFGLLVSWTRRYSVISAIPALDAEFYILSALARLGLNRNQFSMERYVQLTERLATLAARLQRAVV